MIRINLLGGERQVKKKAAAFDIGRRVTALCSLLLVLTRRLPPSDPAIEILGDRALFGHWLDHTQF